MHTRNPARPRRTRSPPIGRMSPIRASSCRSAACRTRMVSTSARTMAAAHRRHQQPVAARHRALPRDPGRSADLLRHVAGAGNSGFTDVSPAMKWQISPVPGKIDLSVVAGVALPTGAVAIAGRGAQPYLQLPWSWELHDGWGVSGMFTEFFRPYDFTARSITETTFVLEKKLTRQTSACSPNMSATIRKATARASSGIRAASITSTDCSRSTSTSPSGSTTTPPATSSASAIPSGSTACSGSDRRHIGPPRS